MVVGGAAVRLPDPPDKHSVALPRFPAGCGRRTGNRTDDRSRRRKGQHRRIFLRCYVRYLQSAALGVNIGAGELGNFSDDIAAVIGKAGTQVFFFSGRSAVGLPVEWIDCQRVSAGGNHQGVGDGLCFAVKGDDNTGIVFTGGKAKMGVLLQIFLTDAPSDGITGHQQFIDLLSAKQSFSRRMVISPPWEKPARIMGRPLL